MLLPSPAAPDPRPVFTIVAVPVDIAKREPVCGLSYIAYRFGHQDMRVPRLIQYVRQLIRKSGFPEPMNPRLYKGEFLHGAEGVCITARWYRVVVDAWLEGLTPPNDLKLIYDAADAEAADVLDARAAAIGARS